MINQIYCGLDVIDFDHNVINRLRKVFFHFLDIFTDILYDIIVVILFICRERCDYVSHPVFILECVVDQVPVIHYKLKMILNLGLHLQFLSLSKGVAHDGYQHVEEMNKKNERRYEEYCIKEWTL